MRRRSYAPLILGLCVACTKTIEGPTPTVSGALNERDQTTSPAFLCNAQGDPSDGWLVDALGDNFAPLPTNALSGTPGLLMPAVQLSGPESFTLPPAYVRFSDKTRMPLAMRTADSSADAHALLPGDYALTVTNLNGASGSAPAAIRVIPAPKITAVSLTPAGGGSGSTILCADQTETLTVSGTGFRTDNVPTVTIGAHTFSGASITANTATTVTVSIPARTFTNTETSATGTVFTVFLTNPEGCRAPFGADPISPAQITAFRSCRVLGTLAVSPRFGYQLQDTPVTITNGFVQPASQPFSGALPRVSIIAPLVSGGPAQQISLRSIAFVDQKTITAVVPDCSGTSFGASSGSTPADCPGIAPGGPYDIQVIDPISGQGQIVGAFTVVSSPPPAIVSLSPASVTTTGASVTIAGSNFDATSSVLLGTQVAGGVEFCPIPVTARSGTTSITVAVPSTVGPTGCYVEDAAGNRNATGSTFSLAIGQYLVRVQHGTDVASGDYSALVVTSASFNPVDSGVAASTLVTARGQFGATIAFDDLGQPFLYVAGGSTMGSDALSSVEVAPVGLFGDLGGDCTGPTCKFRVLGRTPLPTARAGLQLVQRSIGGTVRTSYLYAVGGRTATPTLLNEVWRAQVLRNQDAPSMRQITTAAGIGPGAGSWYYRVAALNPSTDAPETLPSDEESIALDATTQPTVKWGCVAGATGYRIYRSPVANGVSNSEVMLTDVAASCSGPGAGTMTFSDNGTATPDATKKPLPHGALGAWVNTGVTLSTSRFDFQAKTLPNATSDIAVVGGCTVASGTSCTTSTGVVEKIAFTSATDLNPASSLPTGSGLTARDRFGMGIATAGTANVASGRTFLLVFGGETNGTEIFGVGATVQGAEIGNFTFANLTGAPNNVGVGGWGDVISNEGFSEATRLSNHTLFSRSGTLGAGPFSTTADFSLNLNAGVPPYSQGGTRFLPGEQLFRAFIYVVGGFAADNSFVPTNTVERFVY